MSNQPKYYIAVQTDGVQRWEEATDEQVKSIDRKYLLEFIKGPDYDKIGKHIENNPPTP